MKKTKFISIIIACLFLISLASIVVSAEGYDAEIVIDYQVADNGNIVVKASLNNIKAANGVIICEYDVLYDPSALKLKNATVNIPDSWKSALGTDDNASVENWSMLRKDGEYYWSIFSITPNTGIRQDNQLYITIEFEKLSSATTKIQFTNGCVITETNDAQPYQVSSNNASILIDLNTPSTPDIDTDISNPIEYLPPESNDSASEGGSDLRDPIKIPHAGGNNDAGDKDAHPSDRPEDKDHDQENNSNKWIWIISIVSTVVAIFVIIYVIVVIKKPKGQKND